MKPLTVVLLLVALCWIGMMPIQADESSRIRQAPQRLKSGDCGVGRQVPDLLFASVGGTNHRLAGKDQAKATVVAMTSLGCPLCQKYAATLVQLEKHFADQSVNFIFVNPIDLNRDEDVSKEIQARGFGGRYVIDSKNQFATALAATTTTEVFVLDQARTLVYRGAVDDQYGLGYSLPAPKNEYLRDAISAVLSHSTPNVSATTAPGCELPFGTSPSVITQEITYHGHISRIIQANCLECHREAGIGPMAFESYEDVKGYSRMIGNVVRRGVMPPWFASPEAKAEPSSLHWSNDRSLSAQDRKDLLHWVDNGTPAGDVEDAPLPKSYPDGWLIGKPDDVFEFSKPVNVKAQGVMPYRYVTVETELPEDRWVQAIQVRPTDIGVVHHVIVSVRNEDRFDEADGYWAAYTPGNGTVIYPQGYARRLPKGARLRFQMHYTPNGTATTDSTRIGIVYAKEAPHHEVKVVGISNRGFTIPPGDANHPVEKRFHVPFDVDAISFLPHMHLRGKAARYELISESGTQTLLDIPNYDFNWQLNYQLAKPQRLTKGETIRFTGWFDNSDGNPANPDSTTAVKWGPQTFHEMHLGYVEYVVPVDRPGATNGSGSTRRTRANSALFKRLDANKDGFITRAEVRERLPNDRAAATSVFTRLDTDKNDKIDPQELQKLKR